MSDLRTLVPEQLTEACMQDATVHAVFTQAAIAGSDRETALIELALALIAEKQRIVAQHVEHLQWCPGMPVVKA